MSLKIQEITEKTAWEEFAARHPRSHLQQSWNWGEFAQKQGRKVFRVGFFEDDRQVGAALLVEIKSKRANYLEAQGGPLLDWSQSRVFDEALNYFRQLASQEGAHFLRLRPNFSYSGHWVEFFKKRGFVPAPMYFPAEHSLRLDLIQPEEVILAKMRKNTRYGIRRAQREGVEISLYSKELNPKGLEGPLQSFFELHQEAVQRQGFVSYSYQYFENQVQAFWRDNQTAIFLAQWRKQTVAAAIIFFYGNTAYYLHSGSIPTQPEVYASCALQWAIIQEAQKRGCRIYDFWGVAPEDAGPHHPRAGLTVFKSGFGGERIRTMITLDLSLSWRYWPAYLFVRWERWKRGL